MQFLRLLNQLILLMVLLNTTAFAGDQRLVYEGVDYTSASAPLNGGFGWAGPWSGAELVGGPMIFAGMTVVGSASIASSDTTCGRVMQADSPDTCWVAFLAKTSPPASGNNWRVAEINFRLTGINGPSQFRVLGHGNDVRWVLAVADSSGGNGYFLATASDSTEVTLIVLRLTPNGVTMYLNPPVGPEAPEPTIAAATLNSTQMGSGRVPKFRAITLDGAGTRGAVRIDEFRVAMSWSHLWTSPSTPGPSASNLTNLTNPAPMPPVRVTPDDSGCAQGNLLSLLTVIGLAMLRVLVLRRN